VYRGVEFRTTHGKLAVASERTPMPRGRAHIVEGIVLVILSAERTGNPSEPRSHH
jgi:hypothetical protein